jgi:murein DD-endopeptidase MepM/ murein hydrolase activator NlpD
VVDGFRLPDGPYGAGNRGLEYATAPGDQVRAIGDGLVVFAGPVAGNRAVTVLHPDGLRSSYSYLAEIVVGAGERVAQGTVIGLAGATFHLGVRAGGTYLDPAGLFASTGVHLVPVEADEAQKTEQKGDPELLRRAWGWLTGTGTLAARS